MRSQCPARLCRMGGLTGWAEGCSSCRSHIFCWGRFNVPPFIKYNKHFPSSFTCTISIDDRTNSRTCSVLRHGSGKESAAFNLWTACGITKPLIHPKPSLSAKPSPSTTVLHLNSETESAGVESFQRVSVLDTVTILRKASRSAYMQGEPHLNHQLTGYSSSEGRTWKWPSENHSTLF
jgi:hypothetical protein